MDLSAYDYLLPEKNLAKVPASPRDAAKLFVYKTKEDEIIFDRFYHLDKYLPKNSFLVLNETKVIPARVKLKKKTGGKVVVLFLVNEIEEDNKVKIIVDRKIQAGDKLFFETGDFVEVIRQEKNIFLVKFNFSKDKLFSLLEKQGGMPVPLYLKDTPLSEEKLKQKYQTIFFKKENNLASVAAPTASLHFTKRVFKKLERNGIKKYFVNLYVGMGTFAPVSEESLKTKKLHQEYYQVKENIWQKILAEKKNGKKLVAVGTTVVRALESMIKLKIQNSNLKMTIQNSKFFQKTNLFIFPPFEFQMVDILITNFHLPKSSLMMLVEAFLQHKGAKKHLVELYNIAIKNNFRFYSFGDSMLII